jgi:hypothetical protein
MFFLMVGEMGHALLPFACEKIFVLSYVVAEPGFDIKKGSQINGSLFLLSLMLIASR